MEILEMLIFPSVFLLVESKIQPHICLPRKTWINHANHTFYHLRGSAILTEPTESEPGSAKDTFGNVYLGETFGSLVRVSNDSIFSTREISVKAEIHTNTQRFSLTDTTVETLPTLEPNKSTECVIQHEIKELGVHAFVCLVTYLTNEGEKRSIRRVYRFQVMNPLAVKTKVNNMADGKVFLEVQVQNVAEREMYLERMKFESGDVFGFKDLNYVVDNNGMEVMSVAEKQLESTRKEIDDINDKEDTQNSEKSLEESVKEEKKPENIFGVENYLNPQDIRQYLYMLIPKPGIEERLTRTTNALGKLDIVWRANSGETGRLQTSQLTRKPPILEEIELSVTTIPTSIILETPFTLGCRIRNRTTSMLKVVVTAVKNKMGSVLLSGPSAKNLGELAPDNVVDFQLEFVPLSPGLQRVGGLKISDVISGYTKEIDHFTDIFVLFSK
ncbi:5446_t:CDS:2 [Ambispora gerdemannii]|uniref:5446_t:CDS:1 n=1 Tax=Ambispora gerdemannii TaxID=144530 RepID=A0A9N8ZHN2_9GLOM|nr:5446_t:CDS:2 [Ambispora gerdemannii]